MMEMLTSRMWRKVAVTLLFSLCSPLLHAAAYDSAAVPEQESELQILRVTPNGIDVPASRQIVFQFDRNVVPVGRMERSADQIPITITPHLNCEWRWLNTSALACQLGQNDAMKMATRYSIAVKPGITTESGLGMKPQGYVFVTQRPQVRYTRFFNWLSPVTPLIQVTFNQPVTHASVAKSLTLQSSGMRDLRQGEVEVYPDELARELPRFLLPLDGGEPQPKVDDRLAIVGEDEARRVWLIRPRNPLPADSTVALRVSPGLVSSEGSEYGVENRTVVQFDTFPDFAFLGVQCNYFDGNRNKSILISPEEMQRLYQAKNNEYTDTNRCQPLQWASLVFSSPVANSAVRDHVTFKPPLNGGRDDYDPWANIHDATYLAMPHRKGGHYSVNIPESLKAYERYDLILDLAKLRDEFGRKLTAPAQLSFFTAHRRPNFTVTTPIAVLEKGVDSEVPLYVTNLDSIDINYGRVTTDQGEEHLKASIAPPEAVDVAYAIPMGARDLVGGDSGAIAGTLHPEPEPHNYWRDPKFFVQVTPFQVHAKFGHFSSLVWVTDMATGKPVADANISLYKESYADITGHQNHRAAGTTNAQGLLSLPGIEELDPQLNTISRWHNYESARFFLRIEKGKDMALLPLDNNFRVYNADSYPSLRRPYGHTHAWGTTAQGVYKLGDEVEFKIYLRDQSNEKWVSPVKERYTLKVEDPTGKVIHERKDIRLSEFGAFDGRFKVAEQGAVGWYRFLLSASHTRYSWEPLRVLVSDFTPSPFKVRAELNGDNFQGGDEVELSAAATMHSGGPFTDAEVRLTARLKTSDYRSSNPRTKGFTFGGAINLHTGQTVSLLSHTDQLDNAGQITQSLKLPESEYYYGTLLLEASVKDERGKFVAGSTQAKFKGRDRYVGLKRRGWLFKTGEEGIIEALVVDAQDQLAAGTAIDIAIERRELKSSRVKGPGNAYLTRNIIEWVEADHCQLTSDAAPVACRFTPDKAGSYRFTAKVKDSKERQHSSVIYGWATGGEYVAWEENNDSRLQIIAEQNDYKIGDTARYLIQNPYPGSRALITVERYGVLDSWVQTFDSSTPVVQFPVKADYLPGFYLSVVIVSPRVDKPLGFGNVDLGKPAYRMGYLKAEVSDPFKQLDISVTPERENYKPRQKVHAKLHVGSTRVDKTGPIEMAVAVVDESVLALNLQGRGYYDPYRGFNRLDALDLDNFSLLTRLVGRQKFEKKGANSGGDGGAPAAAIRNLFKYVSYWNPSVKPDSAGNAEIEFTVPDNLTGWRILTFAVNRDDLMGLGDATIKVNRETEIRPVMPNQVIEGDQFQAGFNVMNRTGDARTLEVKVSFDGPLKEGSARTHTQQLELAPFKRGNIWIPIATHGSGELKFTVSAGDKIDADGLEHAVPVNKRRSLETAATYGTTERDRVAESILIPKEIYTDVGGLSVVLSPSVIGNIDGAFAYMKRYPHLCWEQRLTKAVMASSYLELKEYMEGGLKWEEARTVVLRQLESAANFQAPNGGMSYWVPENQRASPYLSAYTAIGFNWLRRDGYDIPQAVEEKLHNYLLKLIRRDAFPTFYSKGMSSSVRAVALAALAEHGKVSSSDLLRYQSQVPLMDLFGRSHYLQALIRVGGLPEQEREAVNSILGHASQSGGKFAFNEAWDDSYRYLLATPMRSNCTILSALVAAQNHSEESGRLIRDIPFKLVRSITQTRGNRDHWENTQENVFCMNALVDYSNLYEATDPDYKVAVSFDKKAMGKAQFRKKSAPSIELKRPMQQDDPGRHADVVIEKQGPGRVYYAARLAYDLKEDNRSRINAGIEARREYSVERDSKWQLLQSPMAIKRGEVVRVDLYLSLPTARHFVAVTDPVPGGLEPINADLATTSTIDAEKGAFKAADGSWYLHFSDWSYYGASFWSFYHKELRHDSARFYADYLPAGNYHLSYTAQAIAEGDFSVMPLHAEEMYDPDVYGMGLPARLVVGE